MKQRSLAILALSLLVTVANVTLAQGDGARFYWKTLAGTNAVPVIYSSMSGNANPADPSHLITPGANFSAMMTSAGYAKILPLFNRSAMVSILVPMGHISGNITNNGFSKSISTRGYGDPLMQLSINLIGPKAVMGLSDLLRYEPKLSVDIIGSLALPIGEYNDTLPVNMGQNRWYGRVGIPIVWQIGSWVPGRRTTFECLPAVWLLGDNDDFMGKKLETEPMFQIEAHLTRDFMERFWGSVDAVTYFGGKATVDGTEGESMQNIGLGGTLGYTINNNMQLNLSYSSTIGDTQPDDLQMDGFRVTFIYGWHKVIEGINRLEGND